MLLKKKNATARQLFRFGIVGVLNTAIDFAVFILLYFVFDVPIVLANTAGYCFGVINSFICNKYWTFVGHENDIRVAHQFARFLALYFVGLGISNLVIWLLASFTPALIAKGFATIVSFLWNFWSTRRFVYGRFRPDNRARPTVIEGRSAGR